jgi:hypothetical protein
LSWAQTYQGSLTVFISNAKRATPEVIAPINNAHVEQLEKLGHPTYVLADFIRPNRSLAQCYAVPAFFYSDTELEKRCIPDQETIVEELNYNQELAALSRHYIPVHQSQCPEGRCRFKDERGKVTYRDTHHFTVPGSIYELSRARALIEAVYQVKR